MVTHKLMAMQTVGFGGRNEEQIAKQRFMLGYNSLNISSIFVDIMIKYNRMMTRLSMTKGIFLF